MNQNDVKLINDMLPCLSRYLPSGLGFLCERLMVRQSDRPDKKWTHFVDFVMMEMDNYVWAKWESVWLRLYMRRSRSGILYWKTERFVFAPEPAINPAGSILHKKYEDILLFWLDSVISVLNAKQLAERMTGLIKNELFQRTYKAVID